MGEGRRFSFPFPVFVSVYYKWQKRYMSGSLDCLGDHTLMVCAGSCSTARYDFTALRDELGAISSQDHLFVVYAFCNWLLGAKHANFAPWLSELARFSAGGWPASGWWRHLLSAFLILCARTAYCTCYSSANGSESSSTGAGAVYCRAGAGLPAGAPSSPASEPPPSPRRSNPSMFSATISKAVRF